MLLQERSPETTGIIVMTIIKGKHRNAFLFEEENRFGQKNMFCICFVFCFLCRQLKYGLISSEVLIVWLRSDRIFEENMIGPCSHCVERSLLTRCGSDCDAHMLICATP